jgi:hypothetical protein
MMMANKPRHANSGNSPNSFANWPSIRLPSPAPTPAPTTHPGTVNVTAQDSDGLTPLHLASQDQRLAEVAHVLIQRGACPGAH